MIYSHLLHTEHEQTDSDGHGGAYTIFSTQYPYGDNVESSCKFPHDFAVLWDEVADNRVIAFIEQAIILDVFLPIKILHPSENSLSIVYDWKIAEADFNKALRKWMKIAESVSHNDWILDAYDEVVIGSGDELDQNFRNHAHIIMSYHDLGVRQAR